MFKSSIHLIAIVLVGVLNALTISQESDAQKPQYGWQKNLVGNLNLTQNNFDNWSSGGENSWSWQLEVLSNFVNDQADYNWSNTGKVSFGKAKISGEDARKAADEIKIESVFTLKLDSVINPYAAITGLTQFTAGYNYSIQPKVEISNFLDPGFFTQSIGISYTPNKLFKTRFGAAIKETVTDIYSDLYAKGEKTRVEAGAESVTDVALKLSDNLLFNSKLELFSNIKGIDEIDINWDNLFSVKVSEFINVGLNIRLFYDKDISSKRQLKQTMAVGFSYTLF
jgi:hypothetical protein